MGSCSRVKNYTDKQISVAIAVRFPVTSGSTVYYVKVLWHAGGRQIQGSRNKLKSRSASRKSKLIVMLKKTNSKERDSHGNDDGATGDTNYRWRDRGSRTKETEVTKIKWGETKQEQKHRLDTKTESRTNMETRLT